MSQHTGSYAQIRDNPKFISLIAKRNSYAFLMTALMMLGAKFSMPTNYDLPCGDADPGRAC